LLVGVTIRVAALNPAFWIIGFVVTLLGLGAIWLVFTEEHQPVLPGAA
jgi:hypothetical protein